MFNSSGIVASVTLRVWGGGAFDPSPYNSRVKNFVNRLIYVSIAYIPNLSLLACLESLEKVPVGGWWWWVVVCKPILVFSLSLGQAEQ